MKTKLVVLGALLVAVVGSTAADCSNDGIGKKGRVLARIDTKHGATHTYRLKIRDETKGVITFTVDRGVYKDCSAGEYYPGCKVKW